MIKSIIKFLRLLFGCFTGLMCLTSAFLSFTERPIAPFIIITVILGYLTFLLVKPSNKKGSSSSPEIIQPTEQNEPFAEYVETGNMMYEVDSQSISDEEVPHLIQVGYEKAFEREKSIPKRSSREEDLCTNFMMNHSSEIDHHINNFEELYRKAYSEQNLDLKIELLKQTTLEYEKSKKWFYRTKGGTIYFEDMYEHLHNSKTSDFSYIDSVQEYLDYCIDKRDVIIPQILSAIGNNGIIQKDIYALIDSGKSDIQKTIRELVSENKIQREKKGNSYLLTLK